MSCLLFLSENDTFGRGTRSLWTATRIFVSQPAGLPL